MVGQDSRRIVGQCGAHPDADKAQGLFSTNPIPHPQPILAIRTLVYWTTFSTSKEHSKVQDHFYIWVAMWLPWEQTVVLPTGTVLVRTNMIVLCFLSVIKSDFVVTN